MTCAMALYKSPTVVHFYLLRISNPTVIPRGSRSLGVDRRGTKRRRQTWIDFDVPLLSLRDLRGFKPECEDINLALSAVIYPVCAHDSSCLRRLRRLEEIRKYMRNWRKFIELSVSLQNYQAPPLQIISLPNYSIRSIYYYSPRMAITIQ